MATNKTITPTNVTVSIPSMSDAPNASVFSNCIDKAIDGINAIATIIGTLKLYYADFTSQTPGKLNNIVTLPAESGRYLVLMWYNGYSFANSMSMYFIQKDAANSFFGLQQIAKGSEARTPVLSTDGTVTKSENYNCRCCMIRITG